MEGGDDVLGLKMFYERSRNATLSGLAIGFATVLFALSNTTNFAVAVKYSLGLSIGFALLLVLTSRYSKRFFAGLVWAALLSSLILFLQETRPMMEAIIGWQFLGILEVVLLLGGGFLITRS